MSITARVFGTEGLPNQVVVYIPSTVDVNTPLSEAAAKDAVIRAKRLLGSIFGGYTAIHAEGGWLSGNELVDESVTILYSFAKVLTEDDLEKVKTFCVALKAELKQEAIALEVNNRLILL